jgi:hypothetical protein
MNCSSCHLSVAVWNTVSTSYLSLCLGSPSNDRNQSQLYELAVWTMLCQVYWMYNKYRLLNFGALSWVHFYMLCCVWNFVVYSKDQRVWSFENRVEIFRHNNEEITVGRRKLYDQVFIIRMHWIGCFQDVQLKGHEMSGGVVGICETRKRKSFIRKPKEYSLII